MTGPALALTLITLHVPSGLTIYINPDHIVTLRPPRHDPLIAKDANCILFTIDSKFLAVLETCERVQELMGGNK